MTLSNLEDERNLQRIEGGLAQLVKRSTFTCRICFATIPNGNLLPDHYTWHEAMGQWPPSKWRAHMDELGLDRLG